MTYRPLPRLDRDNRTYWTAGANGDLMLHRCQDCHQFIHPPKPVCRSCLSENIVPEKVAGTGIVDTFTINYQKWHPNMDVPFVLARIALDGVNGVYLTSNITHCDVDDVDIGDRVEVYFEQREDVYIPLFKKVGSV